MTMESIESHRASFSLTHSYPYGFSKVVCMRLYVRLNGILDHHSNQAIISTTFFFIARSLG
jgi:hypothetical protein